MALLKHQLHQRLLYSLGDTVQCDEPPTSSPLPLLFRKFALPCNAFVYTITKQLRGRPQDEYKIQVIVAGTKRGARQTLELGDGRFPLLIGYSPDFNVFALWDATLYRDFAYSRNVQIKEITLARALVEDVAKQERFLRQGGRRVPETILAARPDRTAEALALRLTGATS